MRKKENHSPICNYSDVLHAMQSRGFKETSWKKGYVDFRRYHLYITDHVIFRQIDENRIQLEDAHEEGGMHSHFKSKKLTQEIRALLLKLGSIKHMADLHTV